MRRSPAPLALCAALASCRPAAPAERHAEPTGPGDAAAVETADGAGGMTAKDAASGPAADGGPVDGGALDPDAGSDGDAMTLHRDSREDLLSLFSIRDMSEPEKKRILPDVFLHNAFGTDGPARSNQGNKAIALHTTTRAACLRGLEGVTLQTPEQRDKCGAENMVPVWLPGKDPWFCIDIFEFPNKACELPIVWVPPTRAKKICELQGKRLCSDIEWNMACRGDPGGGADQRYAYGDALDLEACHTKRRHRQACNPRSAQTTWQTCTTDSEPSGSFPKCRSRFGVFDQHGNVAEIMMRREGAQVFTQLKGSAWFYEELAREPGGPPTNNPGSHPDHCNFNPRWHVEPIDNAWHVNYHLGFRCCKSIP
ncbi:MAG: SUMF1/EgtB/PvdO family nonheme iron enzyme [Myxococcales bacterium]|nr:SUMF1/EgtB/PvdO family nonheme iron enzyme [Myxococcales bacterium]